MGRATTRRGFIVWPNGTVEEVVDDGAATVRWTAPGLYDELLLAGYPLSANRDDSRSDGVVDLSVDPADPREVIAYTTGKPPHERSMGAVSRVFLDWYDANAKDA